MATQGIVSVSQCGEVLFKAIAGSNGFNAPYLAEWVRAQSSPFTAEALYQAARRFNFGSAGDLVVQGAKNVLFFDTSAIIDELDGLYASATHFCNPEFNPRWAAGVADYTLNVSVDIGAVQVIEPGDKVRLVLKPDGQLAKEYPLTVGRVYECLGFSGSNIITTTDEPGQSADYWRGRVVFSTECNG